MDTKAVLEETTAGPAQDHSTAARPDTALAELAPVNSLKLRLPQLVLGFIERKPEGVDEQLFEKVSQILFDNVAAPAEVAKELSPKDARALLQRANDLIKSLKREFDGKTSDIDKDFRKDTMEWLSGLIRDLKPEQPAPKQVIARSATREDLAFTEEIGKAAALTTEGYVDFLAKHLGPQSTTAWNAFNVIGAIEKLDYSHPGWGNHRDAVRIASLLSDKLLSVSQQEGVAISEKSFQVLCRTIHTVAAVLDRQRVKDPEKESALFRAAAALSSCATPGNPPGNINQYTFRPLERITSAYLSPQGAAALCAYVDEVHQVAGKIHGAEKLSTLAAAFKSLKGITCWADTPENQEHLKSILTNLNKRLENNKEPMTSEALGSVLSGLRGIEGERLELQVQRELARTVLLASIRVSEMSEVPSLKAICLGIHGVSPSLGATADPLKAALGHLMFQFYRRLPEPPTNMTDLGYACGALNALAPHVGSFRYLARSLIKDVVQAVDYRNFETDRTALSDLVAWAVVQQAHFRFDMPIADGLEARLRGLSANAVGFAHEHTSGSERRVRSILRGIDGLEVGAKLIEYGFEGDLTFKFEGRSTLFAVEVDSALHQTPVQRAQDQAKEAAFEELGVTVIRVASVASEQDVRAAVEQHRGKEAVRG